MKKIIGLDRSLEVCKSEGYGMLETNGPFNPEKYYRFFNHWPSYVKPNNLYKPNDINTDTTVSWNVLLQDYNDNKINLDSFADDLPDVVKNPCYYSLLCLADTINGYQGLT